MDDREQRLLVGQAETQIAAILADLEKRTGSYVDGIEISDVEVPAWDSPVPEVVRRVEIDLRRQDPSASGPSALGGGNEMDAGLMAILDDEHLLRAIECGPMTDAERELVARCYRLLDELRDRPTEAVEKRYEVALEQSYFRAQLIEEVLALCDQPGTKKELVAGIKQALENSYVEL